jgi:uncharacterized membrane protein
MAMTDLLMSIGALGSGLMAGFFFAFSICVMSALGRLPPAQAVAAMQSINVVVINPWFLSVFMGMVVVCVLAVVMAIVSGQPTVLSLAVAAGALYVVGTFLVTMRFNVPLNDALAAVAADGAEAAKLWAHYLSAWTRWNHVRTMAALAATAAFCLALRSQAS